MKYIISVFLLVLASSAMAQSGPTYSLESRGLDKRSHCWDQSGEIVHVSKCIETTFVFTQISGELVRSCKKVDSETKGKLYSRKVDASECRTKNVTFIFTGDKVDKTKRCWALDLETEGENYAEIVHISKCRPDDTTIVFDSRGLDLRKHCWEVDTETMGDKFITMAPSRLCEELDVVSINEDSREMNKSLEDKTNSRTPSFSTIVVE